MRKLSEEIVSLSCDDDDLERAVTLCQHARNGLFQQRVTNASDEHRHQRHFSGVSHSCQMPMTEKRVERRDQGAESMRAQGGEKKSFPECGFGIQGEAAESVTRFDSPVKG